MLRIGSPGSTRTSRKVSTTTPSRTGISWSSRRPTKRRIRTGSGRCAQVTETREAVHRLHPARHLLAYGKVEVGLTDDHPGHVGGQDGLHLGPELLAGGVVDGRVRLRVDLFDL